MDDDDCCWAIGVGCGVMVCEPEVGVVSNVAVVWTGVCRITRSKGSTIVDGDDGVLGFSFGDSKVCWRNSSGDRSKLVASVGKGVSISWDEGRGAGLPC